ncbi:MAG: recombinase RecT [Gloeobacteraceae cyanobacterium ES-bin-316]|nr:recombinase RecT [Ferruginibacter sp.]
MAKNEVAKINKSSIQSFFESEDIKQQMIALLQENSTNFMVTVIDLVNGNTDLQACRPDLIYAEALKAASLKLPLARSLGYGYILPYKKGQDVIPQFQMGYKGYIQLALRSGQYDVINADVVYEGELTRQDKLRGTFDLTGTAISDKVIGFFCYVEMKNGFKKTLYSTVEQIKAHAKKYSKSYGTQYSPWTTSFDEMGIKTVLKAMLTKYGTLSVELEEAFNKDDHQDEINDNANTIDIGFQNVTTEKTITQPPVEKKKPAF